MIRKSYPWLLFLAGILLGLVVSGRLVLLAQDQAGHGRSNPIRSVEEGVTAGARWASQPVGGRQSRD